MNQNSKKTCFQAKLLRPVHSQESDSWAFLVLPKAASEILPRRGRTSIDGTINGHPFQATLEPDGQLSHWLKVDRPLREACGVDIGDVVTLEIAPAKEEMEPKLPSDFQRALAASPPAKTVWDTTTVIARIDWIHWIESAKQAKTRQSRLVKACDMLASGKKRVCCFDPSGFYSKGFCAPECSVK